MKARLRSFIFSIQTKLVLAMTSVILLAILLAGAVFVARTRSATRDDALNRVVAASPAIYQQAFIALLPQEQQERPFAEALDSLAKAQNVRILIVAGDGSVLYDTRGDLSGENVSIPQTTQDDLRRGYLAWTPTAGFTEPNTTLISASSTFLSNGRQLPFRIVLAVKSDDIKSAWLGVLPGLGLAALVAIPLALLAALALARQVAHPVMKLNAASEAMANGDFSQRVEVGRDDEVGRLARSFTSMAERVGQRDNQMRSLLANVSHDLKTPMTSITGYAQALSDGTADSADVERIGTVIREEAEHVNGLIADLLYLGEIDAGQVLTRQEDVQLDQVVARCVRRIEPAARARGVDVSVDVSQDALMRGVDPDKLERALTNVLENAEKFTPSGGDVAVRGWRENGTVPARVLCAVTNSGNTIPDDDMSRVFDRFFRGDRARRTASGSGLGLAITRELVELSGGTIDVRNADERHVTFTLTLPG